MYLIFVFNQIICLHYEFLCSNESVVYYTVVYCWFASNQKCIFNIIIWCYYSIAIFCNKYLYLKPARCISVFRPFYFQQKINENVINDRINYKFSIEHGCYINIEYIIKGLDYLPLFWCDHIIFYYNIINSLCLCLLFYIVCCVVK